MPEKPDRYLADFARYLQFEKRYSALTNRVYCDDLQAFSNYLQEEYEHHDWFTVTGYMVRSWLSSLRDKTAGKKAMEPKTIARKLSSLRSFYKYYLKQGKIRVSPVTGISAPRGGRKLPVYIEEKDAAAVLKTTFETAESWEALTCRVALALFYETGMRLNELVTLAVGQVDGYSKTIRLYGKGGKERIIPVSPQLLALLADYGRQKEQQNWETYDRERLLLTPRGKPVYHKHIYRLVNGVLSEVEDTRHLRKKSPHVWRHSFATHLLNAGAELNAVKELLGHSSLAATQVYTHNSIGKLRDVHRKAHPRG